MQPLQSPRSSRFRIPLLARYEVVGQLGSGAMASVYLARKIGAGVWKKWVALKRIHPHLHGDPEFVKMFLDEASILAALSHPNVAQIFDLVEEQGTYWMVMEYLHGVSLREVVRRAEDVGCAVPIDLACRIVAEAAEGLHAAHDLRTEEGETLNLVHRDVSPHNLFVTYDGHVKVVDFGVARYVSGSATSTGTLKGKLAYMSPEQAGGGRIDRRTDVFALGVVLWELTTGRRLFREASDVRTLARVQACVVTPPSEIVPEYPAELERIAMKALAKDPEARWSSAREMSRALIAYGFRHRDAFVLPDDLARFMRTILATKMRERETLLRGSHAVEAPDEPTLVAPPPFEDETTITRMQERGAYSPPQPAPPRTHTAPSLPPVLVRTRADTTGRIPRAMPASTKILLAASAALLVIAFAILAFAIATR